MNTLEIRVDDPNYMHARYCDPMAGRFLSVDPVPPMRKATPNPQLWNLYAYGGGNPMRYVDPEGLTIELPGSYEEELALIKQALEESGAGDLAGALEVINVNGVNQIAKVDKELIDSTNPTAGLIGGLINDKHNTVSVDVTTRAVGLGGASTRAATMSRSEITLNPSELSMLVVAGVAQSGPFAGSVVGAPTSPSTGLVHEFGHASANARGFFAPGLKPENSMNYKEAVRYENLHRSRLKGPQNVRRIGHSGYSAVP